VLAKVATGEPTADGDGRSLSAPVSGGAGDLRTVLTGLARAGVEVVDVGLRRPTLDDVFLSLTGHAADDTSADERDADDSGSDKEDAA
jgi:ABC-2 type transport system ATP-binding protein